MTGAARMPDSPLLAIETSCDETAVAVFREPFVPAHAELHSQIERHRPFGGVVPEIASREHLDRLAPMAERALAAAGIEPRTIAVTVGPGLMGSLIVGVAYAKALAVRFGVPLLPVHHVIGHIAAVRLVRPDFEPPFLALVVSGGHTAIIRVEAPSRFTRIARTLDDAAGEAFDKAARLLGAGYPGGPAIERLAAADGSRETPRLAGAIMPGSADFSFSGLKTALRSRVAGLAPDDVASRAALAATFQREVVECLVAKSEAAISGTRARRFLLTGGVAANRLLRAELERMASRCGVDFAAPPLEYCTDNAVMIGAAAYAYPTDPAPLSLAPDPSLGLEDLFRAPSGSGV